MKLILADKKEIEIKKYAVPLMVLAECASPNAMNTLWKKLTPEQLSQFSVVDDEGVTLGAYVDGAVTDVQGHVNVDGESVSAHIHIRATAVDLAEKAAAYDILAGEAE